MSQPTPDARAVVRALDALTTQVKRIADHTANPATFPPATPVVDTDDTPTTTNDDALPRHMERLDDGRLRCNTCGTSGVWPGVPLHFWTCADKPSWLAAGTRDLSIPEPDRDADNTCRIMETRTCPPTYNGPCGDRPCARFESEDPTPWLPPTEAPAQQRGANAEDCPACAGTNPPYPFICPGHPGAEDEQRTARRASLRNLLTRVNKGALTTEECALLWQHVDTEQREADTARPAIANFRRVVEHHDLLADELETTRDALGKAERAANLLAGAHRQAEQADRIRAEVQRDRDQHAAVLREVLGHFTQKGHPGEPCLQTGWISEKTVDKWRSMVAPTMERPWWEAVAEAKEARRTAEAAIERVRALADQWDNALAPARSQYSGPVRAALDGAEQPTVEA